MKNNIISIFMFFTSLTLFLSGKDVKDIYTFSGSHITGVCFDGKNVYTISDNKDSALIVNKININSLKSDNIFFYPLLLEDRKLDNGTYSKEEVFRRINYSNGTLTLLSFDNSSLLKIDTNGKKLEYNPFWVVEKLSKMKDSNSYLFDYYPKKNDTIAILSNSQYLAYFYLKSNSQISYFTYNDFKYLDSDLDSVKPPTDILEDENHYKLIFSVVKLVKKKYESKYFMGKVLKSNRSIVSFEKMNMPLDFCALETKCEISSDTVLFSEYKSDPLTFETTASICKSTDGGLSFNQKLLYLPWFKDVTVKGFTKNGSHIIAYGTRGMYFISTDSGENWTIDSLPETTKASRWNNIMGVYPTSDSVYYMATSDNSNIFKLFKLDLRTTSDIETELTTSTNLIQSTHIELYDILGRSIAIYDSYDKLNAEIENYQPPHLLKWRDEKGIFHFEKMK